MIIEPWLERAARTRPGHTAVQTEAGSWSYGQLLGVARGGAARLSERGVRPGGRVAVELPPGLAFIQALHACLLLGAAIVPVDVRLAPSEREAIAAGADVVVQEPLGEGPPSAPAPLPTGHDLSSAAAVIHTSGTTSAPQPVELTYGNFLWSALGSGVALGVDPTDRWLCALPLSHVGGLSIMIRSTIYGTTAVLQGRFDAERALSALQGERITLASVVPTTLARLLDAGLWQPASLRCALTGGGPVPAALLTRAAEAGVPVSQTYGLTEACSQVTTSPAATIGSGDHGAGPPLFCTRMRIDADEEILVRGPTVAPAAVASDGWLHTGDLGAVDGHGNLRVTGRKSDTIISGGENVAPSEVEAVLESHVDVAEAAVVSQPDPHWGEAVTAIVVPRADAALDVEQLRRHCAERLAGFKVPKRIILRSKPLPRTRSGKLVRGKLRLSASESP